MKLKLKMKKRILLPLLGLIGLFVIIGQGSFQSMHVLPTLITGEELFSEEGTVAISVKPLTSEESKKYLRSDALKAGYKPVQITIENQSPDPYLVSPESIELPLVSSKKIAEAAQRSSIPGAIGLKIAGFVFWPLSIPSMMHGIKTHQTYQLMKKDLSIKSIKEEIIPPYSTMNRVFFVKMDEYKESFSVTLVNQETLESKIFSVQQLIHTESPPILDPIPMPEENYYLTHEK